MTAKMKPDFAFWSCSEFPYIRGGPIKAWDGDLVKVEKYTGFLFRPSHVVHNMRGLHIMAELKRLTEAHREASKDLETTWTNKVLALMKEATK